jgi:hypothetical protein
LIKLPSEKGAGTSRRNSFYHLGGGFGCSTFQSSQLNDTKTMLTNLEGQLATIRKQNQEIEKLNDKKGPRRKDSCGESLDFSTEENCSCTYPR